MPLQRFTIDDVRESFAADMAAKIRRVQEAGEALLASGNLATPVAIDPQDGIPGFDAVSHACHAIFGTSALVDARSMAESARLLEILATVGNQALAEIERRARVGRSLGEACVEGAEAMRRMLELELNNRGREAWDVALEFRERMGRWQEAREAIEEGEPPQEFAFDDEPPDTTVVMERPAFAAEFSFDDEPAPAPPAAPVPFVAAAPAPPSEGRPAFPRLVPQPPTAEEASEFSFVDDEPAPAASRPADPLSGELLEVFRQEAREGLPLLEAHLRRLAAEPRDRATMLALERVFHTLMGSAGTVGLTEVRTMAADLQGTLQDMLERGLDRDGGIGPAEWHDLATRASSLVAAAGLGVLEVGAPVEAVAPAPAPAAPEPGAPAPAPVSAELPAGDLTLRRGGRAAGVREAVAIGVDQELFEAFEEETAELMAGIERGILLLEESQQPQAVLLELFRGYHTLKGSVNTVGLHPLGRLIHTVEDFLEELQTSAILPPLRHLATLLLNVQDDLRRGFVDSRSGFVETHLAQVEHEIAIVRSGGPRSTELRAGASSQARSGVLAGAVGASSNAGPASSAAFAPSSEAVSGAASARSTGGSPRRRFTDRVEAEDRRSVRVASERLDGLMNLTGELVVGRSRLLRRVDRLRAMQRALGAGHQRLTTTVDRFRERHEFTLARTGTEGGGTTAVGGKAWGAFSELELDQYGDVNILARSLGTIADEVAAVQAQIQETLNQLAEDAAGFGGTVSGLQGEITRARMVPVAELFARLRLPVRDAAQRDGKSVRVATSGEDVDLDKTIVDKLYVPLLHVVRNAVTHGVESPAARAAAGKDAVGTISLSARQESGLIVIEVADDGGGLDLERLREAAAKLGVLPADTPLDHPSVADAVFLPRVSTRDGADDVAGRGVGGDVVRREIEKLGGDVRVCTTRGASTTFTVTLPLTLAITRALLLRHAGQVFAVPLAFAERLIDLAQVEIVESAGVRRIKVGEGYEPVVSLDGVLGRPERGSKAGAAVLLRAGERRMAVGVDRLLGQEEIVVKALGEMLTGHPLLSGVTLSGDGELILILDVPGLLDPSGSAARDAARGGAHAAALPSGPRRVLFADDSLSVRKVAEKLLSELGAEVTLAVDGQDALEQLGRQSFDLVFTDLEMPRLHGYELIQAIGAAPELRHLPVIVVTSRSGQKHRDEAHALGARDYLTKPFNQDTLGRALRKWAPRGARS